MTVKLPLIMCFAAVTLAAQSFEISPFHSGQEEISASLAFYDPAANGAHYAGVNVDIGRSFSSRISAIGEFGIVSLDGVWLTSYEGGARVNLVKRGRFIPFAEATAGLLHASAFGAGAYGVGFGFGGGVIVRFTNRVETKFELKQNQLTNLSGFALNRWYTTASVGVGYRFEGSTADDGFYTVAEKE